MGDANDHSQDFGRTGFKYSALGGRIGGPGCSQLAPNQKQVIRYLAKLMAGPHNRALYAPAKYPGPPSTCRLIPYALTYWACDPILGTLRCIRRQAAALPPDAVASSQDGTSSRQAGFLGKASGFGYMVMYYTSKGLRGQRDHLKSRWLLGVAILGSCYKPWPGFLGQRAFVETVQRYRWSATPDYPLRDPKYHLIETI